MARDPKAEPRFGDVFEWQPYYSTLRTRTMFIAMSGAHIDMWTGLDLDPETGFYVSYDNWALSAKDWVHVETPEP